MFNIPLCLLHFFNYSSIIIVYFGLLIYEQLFIINLFNLSKMDRKEFFSKVLVGGGLLFFAPTILNSCSKASDPVPSSGGLTNGSLTLDLSASTNNALNTVGGFVYSGNIVIIRTSQSNYAALSRICTHQGCTVSYNSSAKKMICPCHGAQFSTSGSVLQGPATRALTTYPVTVNGTNMTIG